MRLSQLIENLTNKLEQLQQVNGFADPELNFGDKLWLQDIQLHWDECCDKATLSFKTVINRIDANDD